MAIYVPTLNRTVFSGDCAGNASIFSDYITTTANIASGDLLRLVAIPGGSLVSRVVIKNADLDSGTTLQAKIGFRKDDGSLIPATQAVSDFTNCVAVAGAWGQSAATTTYELFPPVLVPCDAHLVVEATAAGIGTGAVYGKVEAEALGVK
jgi:hypothetical protein